MIDFKSAVCRWMLCLCSVLVSGLAYSEKIELRQPLNLSPMQDLAHEWRDHAILRQTYEFYDSLIKQSAEVQQDTLLEGFSYHLSYRSKLLANHWFWNVGLTHRRLSYENRRFSVFEDHVFQNQSTVKVWENRADFMLGSRIGSYFSLAWQSELTWIRQLFRTELSEESNVLVYASHEFLGSWSHRAYTLSLRLRPSSAVESTTYRIRQPASHSLQFAWRQADHLFALGLEYQRYSAFEDNFRDVWRPMLGWEYRWSPLWQSAIYAEYLPPYFRRWEEASPNSLSGVSSRFLLNFVAYDNVILAVGLRTSVGERERDGRSIEVLNQRIQMQFDYRFH